MVKNRIDWIDAMKGFAICTVVLSHCIYGNNIHGLFSNICSWLFSFYMPLFFAASGFFFRYDKPFSFIENVKNKFRSLMVPYFIWGVLIGLSVSYIPVFLRNIETDWKRLFCGILTLQESSSAGWFLQVLFFIYILEYLLSIIIQRTDISFLKTEWFKLFLHIIFFITGNLVAGTQIGEFIRLNRILKYSLAFYFGRFFRQYLMKRITFTYPVSFVSLFASIILSYLLFLYVPADGIIISKVKMLAVMGTGIIGEFLFFYIFCNITDRQNPLRRLLVFYGKDTITVLCTHLPLIFTLHKAEKLAGLYQNETYPLVLTFIIIMIIESILIKYPTPILTFSLGKK